MIFLMSILGFVFVFSLLVLFHEFGHFIMAKKIGIKVDEFAFGFPPRIWSKTKGETRYAINSIPFGGYVKLHGEDGSGQDDPRSFASQTAFKRILVLVAGVFMNFVLAYLIFLGAYLIGFKPIFEPMVEHTGLKEKPSVYVDTVEKDSPAEKEGLKKGDRILTVDGKEVFTEEKVITVIREKINDEIKPVLLKIKRSEDIFEKKITPYKEKVNEEGKEREVTKIGVVLEQKGKVRASFVDSFIFSAQDLWLMTVLTVGGIFDLFTKILLQGQISEGAYGPIGIFSLTGTAAQLGLSILLQFTAMLSIAVGVFNIMPVPGLDGGHILVIAIEKLLRRTFSTKTKNIIQLAGFGALILLVIFVSFKDLKTFGIIK